MSTNSLFEISRPSESKKDRGVARIRQTTRNQNGEDVLTMETVVFLKRREA